MKIEKIKNPMFLKTLENSELDQLSKDIRNFIVQNVSKTGGHLSSNLGVVELTIALHKVFNSPTDKIVFDVSHQCYTHKILTGRAKQFDKLRKINGLSGFQKIVESVYDSYEAGHSSTSLSASLGMALARDMKHQNYNVISVIGDGSLGNGLSYEALNHIGSVKTKLIIILNDNEMSISKNVGALHNNLDKIRSNCGYSKVKKRTKNLLSRLPIIGLKISEGITNLKTSIKKLYLKDGFLFEEMGIKYYGPINGHDYKELLFYLNLAKKEKEPVIIHVITQKGKGYLPSEKDQVGVWHGVGKFNVSTGEIYKELGVEVSWSEIISNNLITLTKQNKNLVVITPAMARGSMLLNYKKLYPNNFFDVGMAEEHALVFANGLSLSGMIPFVTIYSTFLQRGYDQIIHDIARMNSHVIIGIDRCGIVGEDGESHQGIYDLSFLLPIPNLIIATPKDCKEASNLLYTAVLGSQPFAIRYSKEKQLYEKTKYKRISIGSWETIKDGKDAVIITYGDFVNRALRISEKLEKHAKISVINARFQKPIDKAMYESILYRYKKIYIYEEVTYINSLGFFLENYAFSKKYKGEITLFAIKDIFVKQGTTEEIINFLQLDELSITKKIKKDFIIKKKEK